MKNEKNAIREMSLFNEYSEAYPKLQEVNLQDFTQFMDFLRNISSRHKGVPSVTRKEKCLYCQKQNCIKSHAISEGALKSIASPNKDLFSFNDNWYYFKLIVGIYDGLDNFVKMKEGATLQHITTSYASGFDGFCEKDDNDLFDSLDNGMSKGKTRLMWELLYRTVAYKLRFLEEYRGLEKDIVEFADKNSSFYIIWKILYEGTEIEECYSNEETIKQGILGVQSTIDSHYNDLNNIRSYEQDMNLFRKNYCYREIKDVKENINFVGVNYIQYYFGGENIDIMEELGNNLLVAQIPVKTLSSSENNPEYDYYQILICKKESEEKLDDLIMKHGFKYIINTFLIDLGGEKANTFFKRSSNENNPKASVQEKELLAIKLDSINFWEI